jgi:hypothetical protein
VVIALFGVGLFGLWWKWDLALSISSGVAILCGIAAIGISALLNYTGVFSPWPLYQREILILDTEAIVYKLSRHHLFHKNETVAPFRWTLPYENFSMLLYDRSTKTLHIRGKFDEAASFRPKDRYLPSGMREKPVRKNRPDMEYELEIPLYYKDCSSLFSQLEQRSGMFVHPAVRGDDEADLRDLPGLSKPKNVIIPLFLSLVLFGVLSTKLASEVRLDRMENPWQPYPFTQNAALSQMLKTDESVVLDGCKVTLSTQKGTEGGLVASFLWENLNPLEPILLHFAKAECNFRAYALVGETTEECLFRPVKEPRVKLLPGGVYRLEVLFSVPVDAKEVQIELNSDRWATPGMFWQPEYLGRMIEVDSQMVMHNRVTYQIDLTKMD